MTLVCTGREYEPRTGQPAAGASGEVCGRILRSVQGERRQMFEDRARIGGWRLGPDTDRPRHVMCPTCGKPDRKITAILAGGNP